MARAAELEAADGVDARLGEGVNDLLLVIGDDLGLEDQNVVGVVDAEAVRDVFRAGGESTGRPVTSGCGASIAQANWTPVTLTYWALGPAESP